MNQSYDADPEIAKWLRNRDFRHALALGIDRDQLNEVFWLGVGTPGSPAPDESSPYNPGPEWRKKWAVLDVKQANELLDKIGLTKKDAEGYRLRTDKARAPPPRAADRRRVVRAVPEDRRDDHPAVEERSASSSTHGSSERSLGEKRRDANEIQIGLWANDGSELLYALPEPRPPGRTRRA